MATEALLALANLAVWVGAFLWLTRLKRTAMRQDAVALGVVGHYRPAMYLLTAALAVVAWKLAVQGREPPGSTTLLLSLALVGQLIALVAVDRWHRYEERHARSRVELYSDLQGCFLMVGVAGLLALSLIPALIVAWLLFFG